MKVILLQDVRGSGKKDQIIEVSDGFGRNYLLPRKLAREATPEAMNAVEKAQSAQKHRDDVKRQEAEAKARELKGKVIQLSVKGGAGGKLFGAVTAKEISEQLKAQHDMELDSKKLVLAEPIKTFGSFEVKAKLGFEITGTVYVLVCEEK